MQGKFLYIVPGCSDNSSSAFNCHEVNTNMASLVADYSSSGESDDDVDADSVPEL